MKYCSGCRQDKPVDEFAKQYTRRSTRCKECKCRYEHNRRAGDTQAAKNRDLQRSFGISLAEYTEMFNEQEGLCAICSSPPGKRALAVDHNHDTGKVRALLCGRCNVGLGQFMDDPNLLEKALQYLRRFI